MFSIHRLSCVREKGEAGERLVFREMKVQVSREMRNLSMVGGLRYMLRFPVIGIEGGGTEEDPAGEEKATVAAELPERSRYSGSRSAEGR